MQPNQIAPLVLNLETVLGGCITALKAEKDAGMIANTITTVQQALSKLRPVISILETMTDEQLTALCTIHELAVDLVLSLDEKQPHYKPRPHAENVELIHYILECFNNDSAPMGEYRLPCCYGFLPSPPPYIQGNKNPLTRRKGIAT